MAILMSIAEIYLLQFEPEANGQYCNAEDTT
jgi:hypothetical protein